MVDLGAAAGWSAPAASQKPAANQSPDLFSISDDIPVTENRSVDLFSNAFDSQPVPQPVTQAASTSSFWDEPAQPAAQMAQPAAQIVQPVAQQMDLFASLPVSQPARCGAK